jgi:acetoacetate decarboxylase
MFEFHPMGRYMMPAHFGMPVIEGVPSLRYRDVTAMTVVYLTDRDKLAAHLPAPFEVGAEPLSRTSSRDSLPWCSGKTLPTRY